MRRLFQQLKNRMAALRTFMLAVLVIAITAPTSHAQDGFGGEAQYKLSAGDELEVFVWREEELSRPVTIAPDGSLSYPLAGELKAAGLTLRELQEEMTSRIRGFIPKAMVTVSLVKVNGYRIYVLGEVKTPGEYVPGSFVTIAQALSLAEGLTSFANDGSIKVVRQKDGEEIFFKFNYARFKKGKDISSNIRLESGDVVMVP